MSLGHAGQGTGLTFYEGDGTTNVTADKFFKKISMADETICSIQVNFNRGGTGTLAALIKIQGSNHPNPTDEAAGTNEWETLDVVFPREIISGAGQSGLSMSMIGWRWLRVWVDFTSGAGSVEVRTFVKTK